MPAQVSTVEYFPAQIFRDKNEACPVKNAFLAGTTGANQQVIAGVAGKSIRVVAAIIQSQAAGLALLAFLDASGGAVLSNFTAQGNASQSLILPFNAAGWFGDTTPGNGLFLTGGTTASLINLRYIIFTP